jgi:tetratricopeptide (TPR) repeat protein
MLATAALSDRRPHTALAALRAVDPDRGLNLAAPFFWKNRTVALYQLADYRGAADACKRGLKRFPKDYFLAYYCVSSFVHLRQLDEAEDIIAKNEVGAAGAGLAARAAQVMADDGMPSQARQLATKWLDRPSSGSDLDQSRALLLMAAGRLNEAKGLLTKIAESDSSPTPSSRERRIPIRFRALGTLGIVDAQLSLPGEALRIDSLLKSSGENADGGEIEVLRARIHAQLGDLETAVALADAGRDEGWELLSLMNSLADDHWLAPLRRLLSFKSIVALKD